MMKNPRSKRLAIEKAMPKTIPFDPRKTTIASATRQDRPGLPQQRHEPGMSHAVADRPAPTAEVTFNDWAEAQDVWHPSFNRLRDATRRALGFGNKRTTYQPMNSITETATGKAEVRPVADL